MRTTILPKVLQVILGTALLATPSLAQTPTSSTPIIGYYKVNVPAGNSLWVSGFITKTDFQGAASSMTAGATSTISFAGSPFTPGALTLHYAEVMSGVRQGLIMDITTSPPNTANQIRVIGNTTALGLTGTEVIAIRRHATLGTTFKDGAGLDAGSDTVTLIQSTGARASYSWNGGNWEDVATLDDATDVILYPGQGVIITASAARVVTFGGGDVSYVKTTPTIIPIYANIPNLVGLLNPLVSTDPSDPIFNTTSITRLGSAGFDFVNQLVAGVQTVDVRPNTGTLASIGVYASNGDNMEETSTLDDGTLVPVRNGSAVIISTPTDFDYKAPPVVVP